MHIKEKKERALGVRLFLKPQRCSSPKCALVKKPYPPGQFGKKKRRGLSEMGTQLLEKQRVKFSYSLKESQLEKIFKTALRKPENTNELMVQLLERRLDNVVFRSNFAGSRPSAHQLITHGHILVNKKKVTVPSYTVAVGDTVSWREASKKNNAYKQAEVNLSKSEAPNWLEVDSGLMVSKIKSLPSRTEIPFDMSLLVEYYSK